MPTSPAATFPRGKPDPLIFLTAAEELRLSPEMCFVIEDATSGVQAAKVGGFAAIGVGLQEIGDGQVWVDPRLEAARWTTAIDEAA
jgi:beta-phosphoglucomutase-like phosphatase (HAD superfamily)